MLERTLAIAKVTFLELLRSKILYMLFLFLLAVVGLSSFYGSVSVGDQVKVIKDFGLFAVSLFSSLFCVIGGASLLHKELAKKTIYNILSKAVSRSEFILGKFFGLSLIVSLLIVLMGLLLVGYVSLFEGALSLPLVQALYFLVLEGIILVAAALFFSSIVVTPILGGGFTFAFFLAGRSSEQIKNLGLMTDSALPGYLYWVLPHLDLLYPGNEAAYGLYRTPESMLIAGLYTLSFAAVLLTIAVMAFQRREFN